MRSDRYAPGSRFGRLVTVRRLRGIRHDVIWLCRCDCGTEVEARTSKLGSGQRKSCGCILREKKGPGAPLGPARPPSAPYRAEELRLRETWRAMIRRCHNPESDSFEWYGARGIRVCDRWRSSLESFAADMGPRPKGRTLDRINNDGNYEPSNCRWATPAEQRANQRPRTKEKS